MPTAGLLIIGNEILSGKVVDTNSPFLAVELRELGVDLERIHTIPDDIELIAAEVRSFSKAFDLRHMNEAAKAAGARWDIEPAALRRDREGSLYVVDPRNAMVFVFDPAMKLLHGFGGYGTEAGRFRNPTDLALSRDAIETRHSLSLTNGLRVQRTVDLGRSSRIGIQPGGR